MTAGEARLTWFATRCIQQAGELGKMGFERAQLDQPLVQQSAEQLVAAQVIE